MAIAAAVCRLAPDRRVGARHARDDRASPAHEPTLPPTAQRHPMRASQKSTRTPRTAARGEGVRARAIRRRAPDVAQVAAAASAGRHAEAIGRASAALAAARSRRPTVSTSSTCAPKATSRSATSMRRAPTPRRCSTSRGARKKPAMVAQALNRRALRRDPLRTRARRRRRPRRKRWRRPRRRRRPPYWKRWRCCASAKRSSGRATTRRPPRNCDASRPHVQGTRACGLGRARAWWGVSAARSGAGPRRGRRPRGARGAGARPAQPATCTAWATRSTCSRSTSPTSRSACACCKQALAAFEAAGYVERQGVITHNLGNQYSNLGPLPPRAAAVPAGRRRVPPRRIGGLRARDHVVDAGEHRACARQRRGRARDFVEARRPLGGLRARRITPPIDRWSTASSRCGKAIRRPR